MIITEATIADIPAIMKSGLWKQGLDKYSECSEETVNDRMIGLLTFGKSFLLWDEPKLVGILSVYPSVSLCNNNLILMCNLCNVLSKYIKNGWQKKLRKHFEDWAIEHKIKYISYIINDSKLSTALKRDGYKKTETVYFKELTWPLAQSLVGE